MSVRLLFMRGVREYKDSYTPCVWEILEEADEDRNNADNVIALMD